MSSPQELLTIQPDKDSINPADGVCALKPDTKFIAGVVSVNCSAVTEVVALTVNFHGESFEKYLKIYVKYVPGEGKQKKSERVHEIFADETVTISDAQGKTLRPGKYSYPYQFDVLEMQRKRALPCSFSFPGTGWPIKYKVTAKLQTSNQTHIATVPLKLFSPEIIERILENPEQVSREMVQCSCLPCFSGSLNVTARVNKQFLDADDIYSDSIQLDLWYDNFSSCRIVTEAILIEVVKCLAVYRKQKTISGSHFREFVRPNEKGRQFTWTLSVDKSRRDSNHDHPLATIDDPSFDAVKRNYYVLIRAGQMFITIPIKIGRCSTETLNKDN